jgi:hypothetical protein
MRRIIRLTENDLTRLVKRSVNELRDMADKYESGEKFTSYNRPEEITSYDLEGEDFSELDMPNFGGGSYKEHMMMRNATRDIKRKLDNLIGRESYSKKTFETIMMIDNMLKNM